MEIIRKVVRIPENHEITIKVPRHIPENEIAEIILLVKKESGSFTDKISKLRDAAKDSLFAEDMETVSSDFQAADLEGWD